jgi:hypothetical protein
MFIEKDKITKNIFIYISQEVDIDISLLNLNSSLNYDLGIDGDDAIEFFERFQIDFHVTFDEFFKNDYEKYFSNEGINPLNFYKLFQKTKKFTIKDLINLYEKYGAEQGKEKK